MTDIETVDGGNNTISEFYGAQKQGVARMRASLLSCSLDNFASCRLAINNITVMRIYHQVSRIIQYIELMDKLEDKMYSAIEETIERADASSPSTWAVLLNIQERLQKNMIESQKLLQPYLNADTFKIVETVPQGSNNSPIADILDMDSRERLRSSAQAVLAAIDAGVIPDDS